MTRTVYYPTHKEAECIDRAGMIAAMAELRLFGEGEEIDGPIGVMACLRAFKAARNAYLAAREELRKTKTGYDCVSHFAEETNMVFSAMTALMLGLDENESSPNSVAAGYLLMLFQAAKALDGMNIVYSALEENDTIFGRFVVDETVAMAEAAMKTNKKVDNAYGK